MGEGVDFLGVGEVRVDELQLGDEALLDFLDFVHGRHIGYQDGEVEFDVGNDRVHLMGDGVGHVVAVLSLHLEVGLEHVVLFVALCHVLAHGNKFYS